MTTTVSPPSSSSTKRVLLVGGSLAAIIASGLFIYLTEYAAPGINLELHRTVGRVMAQETLRVLGHHGKVVIVTVKVPQAPELKVQVDAYEKQIKLLGGLTVAQTIFLDAGDDPKYRSGAGLSTKHLLKIARKNAGADAIVSFVGVPAVSDAELQQLKVVPKLIAETRSPAKLLNLLDKKVLLAAIVPRFEFPAPGPRKPHTGQEWFERYYQVVAPGAALPTEDANP